MQTPSICLLFLSRDLFIRFMRFVVSPGHLIFLNQIMQMIILLKTLNLYCSLTQRAVQQKGQLTIGTGQRNIHFLSHRITLNDTEIPITCNI